MKVLTIIIILSLTWSFSYSQIDISELERKDGLWTKTGELNPYNGEFIETYENGKVKGTGTLVNGRLEGVRIQYYSNGQKSTEKQYKDAFPHGISKEFYEDGTLKLTGEFFNNKEIGTWTAYYPNGNKQAILNFTNGIQQGPYYEFDQKDKLIRQFYFRNGKADYSDEFWAMVNKASEVTDKFISPAAIEFYDKAIAINPTVAQTYLMRGTAYSNMFNYDSAIDDYNKALELNPNYMEAYANRGSAKINQFTSKGNLELTTEQTSSACKDLRKAIELGEKSIGTEDMIYIYCKK